MANDRPQKKDAPSSQGRRRPKRLTVRSLRTPMGGSIQGVEQLRGEQQAARDHRLELHEVDEEEQQDDRDAVQHRRRREGAEAPEGRDSRGYPHRAA